MLCAIAGALLACLSPAAAAPQEIRLNQLGLLPDGPKRAMLPHPSRAPLRWRLLDAQGRVAGTGVTRPFGQDAASGEHVHRIDFSQVRRTGEGYRLEVAGQTSRPFDIAADTYARLPYDALAYFYHNRAGTPIEARFAGERWARPAGHVREVAGCVSGADPSGNVWPGCGADYALDVTGGWYDAGDHGKYVVNGGISLWTLLNAHETGTGLFRDGSASLPEAGNGVGDLLDEARWQMEFMLRMQVPEGTRLSVPVGVKRAGPGMAFTEIDASGMAHHKVADEKWTSLPTAPHEDEEKRVLFPPATGATLNLAATAAQCARIWREIDPAFSARCLAAAERAWAAAKRNPEVYPVAGFTGSGGYGDGDFSDEFYWAAAELFATTGEAGYGEAVRRSPHFAAADLAEPSWPRVATLGTITLATVPSRLEEGEAQRLRAAIVAAADRFLAEREQVGYQIPYSTDRWPWGSTSSLLNRAMILALAHDFTRAPRYREGVVDAMDFILGRNPLDRSFVSGYGARPMENPHHRFWAHQKDPRYPPPPPGAISGGPNNTAMGDPVAAQLKGKCAAQTCWADETDSYAMNEVAINWNAPLVWVAAWLAE